MEAYILYALSVKETNNKKEIEKSFSLYFSSEEKAAMAAKEFKQFYALMYDPQEGGKELYCLIVEAFKMDKMIKTILSTQVYSPEGLPLDACHVPDDGVFSGRQAEQLCHQPGDLVETPFGEELCIGIVVGQPPVFNEDQSLYGLCASDDAYTIIKYPLMEVDYAYAPLVFKPRYNINVQIIHKLSDAWKNFDKGML